MKKKFKVENSDYGWHEVKKFDTLKQAIECCEHLHKKMGRKRNTRVMQEIDGKFVKVYPLKNKENT